MPHVVPSFSVSFRSLAPGDYTTMTSMEYTFTPNVSRIEISVTISNDDDFEGLESFFATIATTHPGAIISRKMTTIEITDDDRKLANKTMIFVAKQVWWLLQSICMSRI